MTQCGEVLKVGLFPDSVTSLTHALCCDYNEASKPFLCFSRVNPRALPCLSYAFHMPLGSYVHTGSEALIRAVTVAGQALAFRNNPGQPVSMVLSIYLKPTVPLLTYLDQWDGHVLLQKVVAWRAESSVSLAPPTSSDGGQSPSACS